MTRIGRGELDFEQMFSMKITDYSGSISITAFGKYADMVYEDDEDWKEFYVTIGYGENDKNSSINSNTSKIVLTPNIGSHHVLLILFDLLYYVVI